MHRLCLIAAAALTLSACAGSQRSNTITTWAAQPHATIPQEQALAQCRYDIVQNPNNFDNLAKLAGQAGLTPSGHVQGLNANGQGLFVMCMQAKGFVPSGTVPYNAP